MCLNILVNKISKQQWQKCLPKPSMVVHTYNPNTWETDAGVLKVPVQLGLHRETLCQTNKQTNNPPQETNTQINFHDLKKVPQAPTLLVLCLKLPADLSLFLLLSFCRRVSTCSFYLVNLYIRKEGKKKEVFMLA
jgi:hypothetical protein